MNEEDKKLELIQFADGTTKLISKEAGVYLAAHVKTHEQFNSMDGYNTQEKSFVHPRFNEAALRDDYGLAPQDVENHDNKHELNSDNDHYQKQVKRSNLIKLFLQGIEVDKFIMTH